MADGVSVEGHVTGPVIEHVGAEKRITKVFVDELVKKILDGERDFRKIVLSDGFYLCEHDGYKKLQERLKQNKEPLILDGAVLINLRAELNLSQVSAEGADFSYSHLSGSNFEEAKLRRTTFYSSDLSSSSTRFRNADLTRAVLSNTSLVEAYMGNADLSYANLIDARLNRAELIEVNFTGTRLDGADITQANISYANFCRTQMNGIKNLKATIGLYTASFTEVEAYDKDKITILKANKRKQLFKDEKLGWFTRTFGLY